MKIGDLPELTSLASIASGKVPIEDSSGTTKRASVQNLVGSVWETVAPMTTITRKSDIFEDVYADNATITSAILRKSGRLYFLSVTLSLAKAMVIQADGNVQAPFALAQLKADFRPDATIGTVYGVAMSTFYGYGGWGYVNSAGTIVASHFDSIGSQYTLASGTDMKLQFVYMR